MAAIKDQIAYIDDSVLKLTSGELSGFDTARLNNTATLQMLVGKAAQLDAEFRTGEAREFSAAVSDLSQTIVKRSGDSSLAQEMDRIQALFEWASFGVQTEIVQKKLVQRYIVAAYREGFEPLVRIRDYELSLFILDDERAYHIKLQQTAADNREPIGSRPLAEWAMEYNRFAQGKIERTKVDRVTYISQSASTRQLPAGEKDLLLTVLEFFDWLRYPGYEVAGESATIFPTQQAVAPHTQQPAPVPASFRKPAPQSLGHIATSIAPSPQAVAKLKSIIDESNATQSMSLSHALANAGQETTGESGIKMGKSSGSASASVSPSAARPSAPVSASQPQKPAPVPSQAQAPRPAVVVDLTRRPSMEIASISSASELAKINLQDISAQNFDADLQLIKGKIVEFSGKQHLPAKQIVNQFYRSPLYNLYVAMAVAVMNDLGADQKTAFDKVVRNYQAVGKDYLSREQFLSINRFKKELSSIP